MKLKYNIICCRLNLIDTENFIIKKFINKDLCEEVTELSNNLNFLIIGCYINKKFLNQYLKLKKSITECNI